MNTISTQCLPGKVELYNFVYRASDFANVNAGTVNKEMIKVPRNSVVTGVKIKNMVRWTGTTNPPFTSLTVAIGGVETSLIQDLTYYASPYELMLEVTPRTQQCTSPFNSFSINEHVIVARFLANGGAQGGPLLKYFTAGQVGITFRVVVLG